jgi:hypothetical protein
VNQPRDPDTGQFVRKGASFLVIFLVLFLLVVAVAAWPS